MVKLYEHIDMPRILYHYQFGIFVSHKGKIIFHLLMLTSIFPLLTHVIMLGQNLLYYAKQCLLLLDSLILNINAKHCMSLLTFKEKILRNLLCIL